MNLLRCLPVVLMMGLLFFLSSIPGNSIRIPNIILFDKVLHAGAYALLAWTALFAIPKEIYWKNPRRISLLVVFFCMLYGISDEYHQSFVPYRHPSAFDILADTVGGGMGAWSWFVMLQVKRRMLPEKKSSKVA
jgi:VanZ family protein